MKKLNKGFMFYFGIFLAILVAAFLICVVILVLSPGTSIFGLKYFKADEKETYSKMQVYEQTVTADGSVYTFKEEAIIGTSAYPIKKVVISSNAHAISLFKANPAYKDSNSFLIKVVNSTNGFSTEEDVTSSKSLKYYSDTGILELTASIPQGFWVTGNSSEIRVQVPMSFEASGIDLEILGGTGSVVLGDSKTSSNMNPNCLTFKSANIKANSLNVTEYGQIGTPSQQHDCSLNIENGISLKTAIFANNLTIKSNGGALSIRKDELAISALNDVTFETKNVTGACGNVICQNLNLINIYGSQKFGNVKGNIIISKSSRNCDYKFDSVETLTAGSAQEGETPEKKAEGCNIVINKCADVVFDIHTTGTVTINQKVNMNETLTLSPSVAGYFETTKIIKGASYTFSCTENIVEGITQRTFKITSSLGGEESVSFNDGETYTEFNSSIDGISFKVAFLAKDSWKISATR